MNTNSDSSTRRVSTPRPRKGNTVRTVRGTLGSTKLGTASVNCVGTRNATAPLGSTVRSGTTRTMFNSRAPVDSAGPLAKRALKTTNVVRTSVY